MAESDGGVHPVRDRADMIRGMAPRLVPGRFVFASFPDAPPTELRDAAIAAFRETEGLSLILPADIAPEGVPMRLITLTVHSSLEGVGLTAAVSAALADEGIPCNMVAACHHDHVFVPETEAERALKVLIARAAAEGDRF